MARPSLILIQIGILVLACSTCSTAAALSLEDRFQQFQEDYVRDFFFLPRVVQCLSFPTKNQLTRHISQIQFKKVVNEKEVTFEAELIELKEKDQQNVSLFPLLLTG